jgi:ribosomal protein S18 acetylase RimI-like enzyme
MITRHVPFPQQQCLVASSANGNAYVPCTDVTFLCTDPKWSGQGAATALLRELQDMADEAGKAIVLEGVMPAVPLYKRLGFEITHELQMMLPPRGSTDRTERYLEQTMVWMPSSM